MAFAEKNEILGVIKFLRPDYTEEMISDDLIALSTSYINAELIMKNVSADPNDMTTEGRMLLRSAEICFYLEITGMVRETEMAYGIISEETIGNYTKKYENGMPMFFFAQGGTEPFLELLPHETWRMRGYKYVRQFIKLNFTLRTGNIRPAPRVLQCEFERG